MQPLKIDKPIRLIELFAGIGSQAKALKLLNANFEHYKISEWEVNATASYKAIHKENDNTDYSKSYTAEELTEILFNIGISTDGKKPMNLKEIARKGEQWKRSVYNNFKATNNIGSIVNIGGVDLGIVDTDKYCYIMTYSFPCQDLSLAGKQKGMAKGDNTRSGLLWEVERLLNECTELPQILLMENVTQVHGKKNIEHFNEWIAFLESKGYRNYWKDLNAKNFCIPQNRNRTFMVSVLGDYTYEFPQEFPLNKRLKDLLEKEVDEKFYISNERVESIVNSTFAQEKTRIQKTDVCGTLLARDYKDPKCVEVEPQVIGGIGEKKSNGGRQWYLQDRIYDNEIATSVTTAFNPFYKVEEPLAYDEQNGYIRKDGTVGTLTTDGSSPKHNNRVIENCYVSEKGVRFICSPKRGMATDVNADICQPLTAKGQANWTGSFISPDIESLEKSSTIGSTEPTKINLKNGETITSNDNLSNLRIRKLTPKECWRLMGFTDEDFEKAAQYNSNSQLYKQAGNSIVVSVLYYIFKGMM